MSNEETHFSLSEQAGIAPACSSATLKGDFYVDSATTGNVILAVIATTVVFATAGRAQMPGSPWKKAWLFPEPDEEYYGVAAGGKMYVKVVAGPTARVA